MEVDWHISDLLAPGDGKNTVIVGHSSVSFGFTSSLLGCVAERVRGKCLIGVSICNVDISGYRNGCNAASQLFTFDPELITKANSVVAWLTTAFQNVDQVNSRSLLHVVQYDCF